MNNPGGRVGFKLDQGGIYERELLVDTYQHHLTGAAFDVGAHVGNHTLWYAVVCGLRTYAWEPHDKSRRMLLDNLALNKHVDVTVFDWGAGDRVDTGRFTPGMWLEFDPSRDGATLEGNGDIKVYPIDLMVDVPDLALVKIDVEGMEPQVLAGMTEHISRSRPLIYCEAHTDEAVEAQGEILRPFGYEIGRFIKMGSRSVRWQVVV